MSLLIVCLPSIDAGLSASYGYVQSGDGVNPDRQSGLSSATAALLPAIARAGELVVVIPTAALSWHCVDLPAGLGATSPRLRAVLAGLLEDQLLDDEERLHFAIASQTGTAPDGKTWVMACDKAWLKSHLQALETAQRPAGRLVPEFSPDTGPLQLYAVEGNDSASWVMTGNAVGGLMRLPFSAAALSIIPELLPQQSVAIFAEPALVAQAEEFTQSSVGLVTQPQRWLEASRSSWDLAQFDLAQNARSRTAKKISSFASSLLRERQWRPVRWGVAVFLLANLAGLNVWAWQQNARLGAMRASLQSSLTQNFPNVKVVVDAPVQMQREVSALRLASGALSSSDLETMLAALATAAPASSISNLDYSAGELRVKGLAENLQTSVAAQMKSKGYTAQLEGDTYRIKPDDKASP